MKIKKEDRLLVVGLVCLTLALMGLAFLLSGCAREPKHGTAQAWIAQENAKKKQCDGMIMGAGTDGYNSYSVKCVDGVMVYEDTTEETQQWQAKENQQKQELITAARTRALTAKETKELLSYGPSIFTRPMEPFMQETVEKQFNELLLQQMRLKAEESDENH